MALLVSTNIYMVAWLKLGTEVVVVAHWIEEHAKGDWLY
jgi:hypothetical protein